jgi:hypothetical protein
VYEDVIPYWDSHPPRRRIGPAEFIFIPNPYVYSTIFYLRFKLPVQLYTVLANRYAASSFFLDVMV